MFRLHGADEECLKKKKNKILNYAILDINTVEKVRARESKKGNTISS